MALLRVALVGVAWQLSSSAVLRSSRGEDQLQRDAKAFAAKVVIAPKPTELAEGSLRAGETCFDTIADWKDVQGDSCQSYHDNQYCDRKNGVFFGTKTAMMLYHAGPDSPAQVCCHCGGGVIKECDEMCRLLKKHEASEIESKFDAMRDAAGDAVTEAGAASMASMVKQMNASMEDALERLHAHSSKMLKEELAAEESSFERMAASSALHLGGVLSPKAATAETDISAKLGIKELRPKLLLRTLTVKAEGEEPSEGTARLIEVEVSLMSGDTLKDLSVPDTCLISELKLRLEQREGIPHQQLQLLLPGVFQNLEDQQTVKDCDVSGGRLQLILVRNSSFFPSKTFTGSKEGYIFTSRDQGVGYYIDSYEEGMGRGASDPWDGLWEDPLDRGTGTTTTIIIERGTVFWGAIADSRVSTIVEKSENQFTVQSKSVRFRATLAGPDDLRFDGEVRGVGGSIVERYTRVR
ncbi:uxs1 [Symbiodinium sp. CCMP2592]|nr:uxs1 [Symbiodinium sp. CCMP2592]